MGKYIPSKVESKLNITNLVLTWYSSIDASKKTSFFINLLCYVCNIQFRGFFYHIPLLIVSIFQKIISCYQNYLSWCRSSHRSTQRIARFQNGNSRSCQFSNKLIPSLFLKIWHCTIPILTRPMSFLKFEKYKIGNCMK